jgi:hypothetical protein
MRSTFALIRPAAVAAAFDDAVERIRATPLALATGSIPLIEARLLCGDFEAVARVLSDSAPHPALPLAVARLHDWTGDLHTLTRVFPAVRAALETIDEPGLRGATWAALQRAATDFGDTTLAATLARRARAEPGADAAAVAAVDHGPAGIVLTTARLFGPDPDAFRGRITLRPNPADHAGIEARNLRFADGSLSLTVERTRDALSCTIEQETGATPFTVLLEPVVDRVDSAEVDGRPARLDVRPVPGGVTAPVQLVLDDVRTVVLR